MRIDFIRKSTISDVQMFIILLNIFHQITYFTFVLISSYERPQSQHCLIAPYIPGPELPELHEVHLHPPPRGNTLHLLGNVLLTSSTHINIKAVTRSIVTTDCLSKIGGNVSSRAMDD